MKRLTQFISEKLKINSKSKVNSKSKIEYFPQTKNELKDIIVKVCKESTDKECVNLNIIDTSKITDLSFLFTHSYIKNALKGRDIEISDWDVSNVKDFHCMFDFYGLSNDSSDKFNFDLSKWDVSNGRDFNCMFTGLKSFEGKGLENWNMENAISISHMFRGCKKLNCDLSKWTLKDLQKGEYIYVFDDTFFPTDKMPKYKNRYVL